MPNGKSLAGNLEVLVTDQSRSTETPVHLSGFDELGVQLSVVLLKCCDLQFQFPLMRPLP